MLSLPILKMQKIINAIKDTTKTISAIAPMLVLNGDIKPGFGLNRIFIVGSNFLSIEFASQKQTCSPISPNQKRSEIGIFAHFASYFNAKAIKEIAKDERTEKITDAINNTLCSLYVCLILLLRLNGHK